VVASGDTSAYIGVKDIAMMPSIVDVAGVNRLSSKIIANAAGAIAGMVKIEHRESDGAKPMIAATMFGVTTAGVTKAREIISRLATKCWSSALSAAADARWRN
jgi:uncharacterized protein (UPF0261 family)